ncbi:MAG: lipid-A-disaccharide synthase [Desulfobacteraceae bacterium]|nr:lipid-A-disaccharide synthase [Desulfobacteraceae bacterium]
MNPGSLMIIAGEASADAHGAGLVRALRRRRPDLACFGVGGPALRDAGVEIIVDAAALAVVGITEVAAKARALRDALGRVRRALARRRPGLLVLIDLPDFNLMVAATARRLGVPVLYYIGPQIWAWRPGRIRQIAQRVDHMAVILPFEASLYRRHGVPVTFVGHPLMDAAPPPSVEAPGPPRVGLLPGSRDREIERHLPQMLAAARQVARQRPDVRWTVSIAPGVDPASVHRIIAQADPVFFLETATGGVRDILAQSTLVVAASGTVTLEAAVAGTPTIIVYKVSALSYRLGRALIRVPFIGLANLIAEAPVVPELIQDQATGENIAGHVLALLQNPARRRAMRTALARVRRRLGPPGAGERVAAIAWRMLTAGPPSK